MLTEEGRTETEIRRLPKPTAPKEGFLSRPVPLSSRGAWHEKEKKENTVITQGIKTAEALLRELYAQKCQIDI